MTDLPDPQRHTRHPAAVFATELVTWTLAGIGLGAILVTLAEVLP